VNTSTSRRNFLKGAAAAGAVSLMGSHTFATPRQVSVIVVGAGAFGGWSALHLAQAGAKVTLLDAWGPGNSRASSGGETRTIRATYGPAHVLYAKMVAHALQLWQEYESDGICDSSFAAGRSAWLVRTIPMRALRCQC
jgi:choline dehydrogenase-like flavoprotein